MRNIQDSFETRKSSFISAFSICMTVLLKHENVGYLFKGRNKYTGVLPLKSL